MEWSVGHSTPAGKRGKTETPQFTRRLSARPAERKQPEMEITLGREQVLPL
ncbi:hypothetical protein [Priestia flexa]|uniref:hypothetical protein n=1 Tax=Priestia flexa TaxID=86664 RepID=UPI00158C930D|nr:hypothetical protein [Priestia flexa]MBY6086132.1 hypothetical protein [Priestia flexa]